LSARLDEEVLDEVTGDGGGVRLVERV